MLPIKTTKLLTVLTALALLCSCARTQRFGLAELERRLCKADRRFAFQTEDVFREDGIYHIFYRTDNGTLLLKVKEDERRRIDGISLTMAGTDKDAARAFSDLACALTEAFWPEENLADAKAALGLADPAAFFTDETLTAACGRYEAEFFKTAQGVSLMLRYLPAEGSPATETDGAARPPITEAP